MIARLSSIRAVLRKLADQTLVYADWDGFAEMALPGDAPAGLLRWCSRMVMTSALSDGLWFVPYLVIVPATAFTILVFVPRRWRFRWFSVAAAVLAALGSVFLPVMGVSAGVWLESECSYPVMNPLGMLAAAWLFIPLRGFAVRSGAASFAAVCVMLAMLYVPLGAYALAPLVALAALRLAKRRPFAPSCVGTALFAAALAMAAVPFSARFVYGDTALPIVWRASHAFRPRWNGAVDVGPQLEQEDAVKKGDFGKVLAIADLQTASSRPPLRMSVAYRILAQYRLGRLPDDIFKYPMPTSHAGTDAEELMMDGYVLLFNYGFLMPARREIYEIASMRGWQPCHFRMLGDIAAITGELALACRYYRQLSRCPMNGSFARRRLDALERSDASAFSDIAEIADMHRIWQMFYKTQPTAFFSTEQNVESFIYNHFRALKSAPDMMVRMFVTAMLLECEVEPLLNNTGLIGSLGAAGRAAGAWPVPVQEAVIAHIANLPEAERAAVAEKIPKNAIEPTAVRNFNEFFSRPQSMSLSNPFATTYFFYRAFLYPAGGNVRPSNAPSSYSVPEA